MNTNTRFSYYDELGGSTYVGEAEIEEQVFNEDHEYQGGGTVIGPDVHVTKVWECGLLAPRLIEFIELPLSIRVGIRDAVLGNLNLFGGEEIQLPNEWDTIEVIDTETIHTVRVKAIIPDIKTDSEAELHGLSTVRRVLQTGPGEYRVHIKGPAFEMQRELRKIILF